MDIFQYLQGKRILFLFPHPDDESYSCFALIRRLIGNQASLFLQYLTTGVPLESSFAPPFSDDYEFEEYLRRRAEELQIAMRILGIYDHHVVEPFASRTLVDNILDIFERVQNRIKDIDPQVVFTCPYEGAHPDHDICNLIAAFTRLRHRQISVLEYTGYHLRRELFRSGKFLANRGLSFSPLTLTENELAAKGAYLQKYVSQKPILEKFTLHQERFRFLPIYNYSQPPTTTPYYASWPSGISQQYVLSQIKTTLPILQNT
ncbi:MAG: PIG-L deacetylase family protein [Aggregatilineales bacterium]